MTREYEKLTPELRAELLEEAENTWNRICYDVVCMGEDNSMSGEDCRDFTIDYVDHPKWFKISSEDRREILKEAIPAESYCL